MSLRGKISLILLLFFYGLVSLRLFPGQWEKTFLQTGSHLLMAAPYTLGATLVIAAFLKRMAGGDKLSRMLLFRIFITVSIVLEFFLGLYDYVSAYSC